MHTIAVIHAENKEYEKSIIYISINRKNNI